MKKGQDRLTSHTEDEWNALDPILLDGEIGINRNGGRFKYGDGIHPWSQLVYLDQNFATTKDIEAVRVQVDQVSVSVGSQVSVLATQLAGTDAKINAAQSDIADIKKQLPVASTTVPVASTAAVVP